MPPRPSSRIRRYPASTSPGASVAGSRRRSSRAMPVDAPAARARGNAPVTARRPAAASGAHAVPGCVRASSLSEARRCGSSAFAEQPVEPVERGDVAHGVDPERLVADRPWPVCQSRLTVGSDTPSAPAIFGHLHAHDHAHLRDAHQALVEIAEARQRLVERHQLFGRARRGPAPPRPASAASVPPSASAPCARAPCRPAASASRGWHRPGTVRGVAKLRSSRSMQVQVQLVRQRPRGDRRSVRAPGAPAPARSDVRSIAIFEFCNSLRPMFESDCRSGSWRPRS